jgi:hypothetical protein
MGRTLLTLLELTDNSSPVLFSPLPRRDRVALMDNSPPVGPSGASRFYSGECASRGLEIAAK